MKCPQCRSEEKVKNGFVRDTQRYKCKNCGHNYTKSSRQRHSEEKRKRCIELYLEGVGFRGVSRLEDVSHTTVMNWVRELGDRIQEFIKPEERKVAIMELDEMHHFVKKKRQNAGSGQPMIEMLKRYVGFSQDAETPKLLRD